MAAGGAANAGGVEVCALYEDVGGGFRNARVESAEDAGNAEGLFVVTNHQVGRRELVLHAVEGGEGRAVGAGAHLYLVAVHMVEVEAVERLADA